MAAKLKIGIIGCGGIANGKHMPNLAKIEEVEMIAFCDIVKDRAEKAKKDYGSADAKVYTDYKKLLADKSIDVVHVLTPNREHSFISIDALEAGKHVMCEKPMAKTSKEAQAMVDAAKRTGKKLTIGYQNRFRPECLQLRKVVERGDLGDIYVAKAHAIRRRGVPTWGVFLDAEAQGGGPLIDIGTHALDMTLWLMNNYSPKSVVGNVYRKLGDNENSANAFGPWDPKKFTVEDSAFGFITMEDNSTIFLESSWAINMLDGDEAKTTLCGTKGGADMKDPGLRINGEEFSQLYAKSVNFSASGVAFFSGITLEPAFLEARQWIDSILNDEEPMCKPEQALVVTQILEAIYKSSDTGKPVNLVKKTTAKKA